MKTLRILRSERPDTVFVMTPPLFAALPAFWYAWRFRKRVVLDAHSGTFLDRRWRHFQWLQRILCRRAVTTLVTNDHLAGVVRAAGGQATVVPDVPVVFPVVEPFPRPETFTVAVICSFDCDEPVDVIFAAAARLPEVRFFVTGDARNLPPNVAAQASANITLTGFLSAPMYAGLLSGADVVLVLTTLDHTMLRGAYEAIYQGTPVIVSDWPILRDAFPRGALHVDNTIDAIVGAIRTLERDPVAYREGARRLRETKQERWKSTRREIEMAIADPDRQRRS
jgi:glycosyltransferase involved in cell wall biosynthesis